MVTVVVNHGYPASPARLLMLAEQKAAAKEKADAAKAKLKAITPKRVAKKKAKPSRSKAGATKRK